MQKRGFTSTLQGRSKSPASIPSHQAVGYNIAAAVAAIVAAVVTFLQAGPSPLQLGPKAEERGKVNGNPVSFLLRLLLGTAAGFYYFLVSANMCAFSCY